MHNPRIIDYEIDTPMGWPRSPQAEGGPEDCIYEAIESRPVECIHWED